MIFLFVILILIVISSVFILDKLSKVLIVFYLLFYFILLSLSIIDPYNLFKVSNYIYLTHTMGVVSFVFGYMLTLPSFKLNVTNFNIRVPSVGRFITILLFFSAILFFYYFKKFMDITYMLDSVKDSRHEMFVGWSFFSNAYEKYFVLIFRKFIFVFSSLFVIVTILEKKKYKLNFYLSLTIVILISFTGGGRQDIARIVSFILIYKMINFGLSYKSIVLNSMLKGIAKSSFFIIVFLTLLTVVTASRNILLSDMSSTIFVDFFDETLRQASVYFVGPIRAFEYGINHNYVDKFGLFFGRATFAGFDDLIGNVLSVLGIPYKTSNILIGGMLAPRIYIGSGFNYAYTHFFIFYLDFGYFGVIILSFIYGIFMRKMIYYYMDFINFYSFSILVYLMYVLFFNFFSWGLQSPPVFVLIVVNYFLSERLKKNIYKTTIIN